MLFLNDLTMKIGKENPQILLPALLLKGFEEGDTMVLISLYISYQDLKLKRKTATMGTS